MHAADAPIVRDLVLIGGGHSHVGVLKRFGMKPLAGARLTVICRDTHTPYSGMLPGYVAGHYNFDDAHIDLRQLAEFAKARFYGDEVIGIDRAGKRVLCRNRPPVPYDILSINIGSTPQVPPRARDHAVPVKPINTFNQRWLALLERVRAHRGKMRLAVVGAGAGGVEMALAIQYRLRNERRALGFDPHEISVELFSAVASILPTHSASVRRRFERVLRERGIGVHTNSEVVAVTDGSLRTGDDRLHVADEVVWVTRAGGAAWLTDTGLTLDKDRFIRVHDTLQTLSDPNIFAAGDIADVVDHPREKAGVFAVRQGPPLADNLRRALLGEALHPFTPQRHWLALISTGDRVAIASRTGFSVEGPWVWRWKDWIDQRFMRKFSEFPPMAHDVNRGSVGAVGADARIVLSGDEARQAISALAMRCGGCGAKVGADVLSRALADVRTIESDDVLVGLDAPDDAAVVRIPAGKAVVQTVDFFRAFIDDPYLFGKIAANHALGDIWAMGATAQSATAIVTVPPGLESKTEDLLRQLMTGAVDILNQADCALVGGHTGEGRELALGFAINGLIDDDASQAGLMRKSGLSAGDALILTKPIGTGTLFAALPQLQARGRWIDAALASMMQSNRAAARILREHGARACTDVTGFGLLGHLIEMTRASAVDARLTLSALPILDGAEQTVAAGVLSSLQPANVRLRRAIADPSRWIDHPRYPLLFDPQTAGGLLAGVPAEQAGACVNRLRDSGYAAAAVIGHVMAAGSRMEPISLSA